MADFIQFAPTDYGSLQQKYDFGKTLANGYAIGTEIRQRQLENEKEAQAQARGVQMQADFRDYVAAPSLGKLRNLMVNYPEVADKLKIAHDSLSIEQQNEKAKIYGNAYFAIKSGHPEVAIKQLQDVADAYRNSGDENSANDYEFAIQQLQDNPNNGLLLGGMWLSQAGDKGKSILDAAHAADVEPVELQGKVLDNQGKVIENKTKQVTADFAEPAAQASLDKAQAEAATAQVTAQNAPEKQQSDIRLTQAQTVAQNEKPIIAAAKADLAAQKEALKSDPYGVRAIQDTGASGDEFLKQLPPSIAAQVKAFSEGKRIFPTGAAFKSDKVQQMVDMVYQYDPSFDQVDYNKRAKTLNAFTSGQEASKLRAASQAITHASQALKDVDALDNFNGRLALLNTPTNFFEEEVLGDTRQVKLRQSFLAVTKELEKAFAGQSGGNLTEFNEWKSTLPVDGTAEQQRTTIIGGLKLLKEGVMDNLEAQYRAGMGSKHDMYDLFKKNYSTAAKNYENAVGEKLKSNNTTLDLAQPPQEANSQSAFQSSGMTDAELIAAYRKAHGK